MKLTKRRLKFLSGIFIFLFLLIFTYFQKNKPIVPVSPTPTITLTPPLNKNLEKAKVIKVIDGDTIEIENKRKVRYIGIDTPETKDPRRAVQCFGEEAYLKNKELVEGREVALEKDVSDVDKFGRLLRYVYVDGLFINEYLVREGFAHVSTFPPDVKYINVFLEAEREARASNRGLWKNC